MFPAYAETAYRAVLFGDEIEALSEFDPLTGEVIAANLEHVAIWPATHYNVADGSTERAAELIGEELAERTAQLESEGKLLEAHRLRQRTQYDMEMLREVGYCSGIENYSRILDAGRAPGERLQKPDRLWPAIDLLRCIDESHQTILQIGGMYEGDRSRGQADARRLRIPPAERARQPPADLRGVPARHAPDRARVGDPRRVRAHAVRARRRADRPT